MAGGRLSGALPDSVMLSFATRVTYDNDIHQKKKKKGTILDLYISVSRVDTIFED